MGTLTVKYPMLFLKVTVYLQGRLASKRYVNPYIKLKLIQLAIILATNLSVRITLSKLQVKADFVFRLFNFESKKHHTYHWLNHSHPGAKRLETEK